ncbi:branched-chain amino acid ABC transporter permease [Haloarculaceae archaeon H-GB11]|nr:branched-chain amino acid ABC transporter permease [Haloarculaceae archaeon H-GB11]
MSTASLTDRFGGFSRGEQVATAGVGLLAAVLLVGVVVGWITVTYLLYLVALAGMYVLLSMGLNVQWGYGGLINFSVAAFFGVGAYGSALLTADSSPIAGGFSPVIGLVAGLLVAAVLAVIIGIPTLQLRDDYLAIASLGLAEVVRMIVLNEREITAGSAGLTGIPLFFADWPVLGSLEYPFVLYVGDTALFTMERSLLIAELNVLLVVVFIAVVYLFLRRIHLSPWGRVLRTIRTDEDLAKSLGKDTYRFKMQAFVIGSVIMALAGVFYTHLVLYLNPQDLAPVLTFYVWIAVILGGSGSDRGAIFGGSPSSHSSRGRDSSTPRERFRSIRPHFG